MALLTLPKELVDHIASFLPYPSALALTWTCKDLHKTVDPAHTYWTRTQHSGTRDDLLIIEQWPEMQDLYACCACETLRPRSAFSMAQTRGHLRKGAESVQRLLEIREIWKNPNRYHRVRKVHEGRAVLKSGLDTRFCIDCGVLKGRYLRGVMLQFPKSTVGGTVVSMGTGIVCKRCGQFKVCDADSRACLRRTCFDCLAYRPPGMR